MARRFVVILLYGRRPEKQMEILRQVLQFYQSFTGFGGQKHVIFLKTCNFFSRLHNFFAFDTRFLYNKNAYTAYI